MSAVVCQNNKNGSSSALSSRSRPLSGVVGASDWDRLLLNGADVSHQQMQAADDHIAALRSLVSLDWQGLGQLIATATDVTAGHFVEGVLFSWSVFL